MIKHMMMNATDCTEAETTETQNKFCFKLQRYLQLSHMNLRKTGCCKPKTFIAGAGYFGKSQHPHLHIPSLSSWPFSLVELCFVNAMMVKFVTP